MQFSSAFPPIQYVVDAILCLTHMQILFIVFLNAKQHGIDIYNKVFIMSQHETETENLQNCPWARF